MLRVPLTFAIGSTTSAWVDLRTVLRTAGEMSEYSLCAVETPATLEAATFGLQFSWDVDNPSRTGKPYQRDDGTGALENVAVPVATDKVVQLPVSDFNVLAPMARGVVDSVPVGAARTLYLIFRPV